MSASMPDEVFDTGLIADDILRIWRKGETTVTIGYRKPQITGIWLEGSDDPLRVPMPGLVMARKSRGSSHDYSILVAKRKPVAGSKLFECPLPNTGRGGVCWGTVQLPSDPLTGSLADDWRQFLGSRFANHAVGRKCKSYPDDIRKLFMELHDKKTRSYPAAELIDAEITFVKFMEKFCK